MCAVSTTFIGGHMKLIFSVCLFFGSIFSISAMAAKSNSVFCTCELDGVTIYAPSPNYKDIGQYFDVTWLVQGSPKSNTGKSCGKGGFILDKNSEIVVGPLSKGIGNYSNCFLY
jgi:hypothetical protein